MGGSRGDATQQAFVYAVESAIAGGVGIVQLREKNASAKDFLSLAISLKSVTEKKNIPLLINDRVDVAILADADGVHLGQGDLPADDVRRIIGSEKIIGVSAATVDEAIRAEAMGADYIGCGALFPTSTKDNTRSVNAELLKEICNSVEIPVVGIGGIKLDNIPMLKGTGIAGVAVVSAIMGASDIRKSAEEIKKAVNGI